MPSPDALRRHVEELALGLALAQDDSSTEWRSAARQVEQEAASAGVATVASAAGILATALAEGECTSPTVLDAVRRLQDAAEGARAATDLSPAEDPELIADFVLESREHLAGIEAQALTLERTPSDREALNSAFRAFHTIKGLAGFLALPQVQEMAHQVEAVLDRARNGDSTITTGAIDVILLAADYLRRWVAHVEAAAAGQISIPPPRDAVLLARIGALCEGPSDSVSPPDLAAMAHAVENPEDQAGPRAAAPPPEVRAMQTMSVKVDTGKLDALVDMAGELVIAESLVRHDDELSGLKNQRLQRKIAHLTRITAELQKTAMAMRLVPVGPLFRRMARLVRDLARQFGKRVELEIVGGEIELDRTIVEELADPMMHMVRNALDHGIESPDERERAGKPGTARLLLSARHQGGQVVVEIGDDGRGLDRERIVGKAMERGLIATPEGLSDNEAFNLIFQPGFSTATEVTNVSGRGVGMDVVRRHVEKLRGRIEIRSVKGEGASFMVKLPLTLAIIDGLVVGVGHERYIVPLFAVREMFRPGEDVVWTVRGRDEMALVRGALLPVLRLYRRFRLTPKSENPRESVLVVAEVDGQQFCLVVDELIGKQEVVIKSLGEVFRGVTGVAGGAIMGDGRVGLILDVDKLFAERNVDAGC